MILLKLFNTRVSVTLLFIGLRSTHNTSIGRHQQHPEVLTFLYFSYVLRSFMFPEILIWSLYIYRTQFLYVLISSLQCLTLHTSEETHLFSDPWTDILVGVNLWYSISWHLFRVTQKVRTPVVTSVVSLSWHCFHWGFHKSYYFKKGVFHFSRN